ncbi:glycosyltransferase [Myxococcus landrumensis]|uniref:Glycosyltransferase n=2 Tax=Myxococcus landrumensis TaxID=2813577 RepID=A0ABX7NH59_9BACT|nr:glycosyltransferase [Myxococcus landrumus]
MARAFADAGHEVHVLTAPQTGLERAELDLPGLRVHAIHSEMHPAFAGAFPFPPPRHAMDAYQCLLELHARHAFDYIEFPESEFEGYFALRARRTLGHFASAVLAVRLHTPTRDRQELDQVATLDLDAAQQQYMEDGCIQEADLVLSATRALLDKVSARLKLERPGVVIPPPFPSTHSTGPAPRATSGRARVLYVGDLARRKGVHLLVDAMQALFEKGVDAELELIGADTQTGPSGRSMRAWLERRIAPAWRERIHFTPPRSASEHTAAITSATVCALPSLWDNAPDFCLEAMAAGALVVASDGGGLAEFIEAPRSGLLFRAGDVAHLTETLEKALSDAALREQARIEAPARIATRCAPASIVKQVEAAMASVAHVRNRALPKPRPRSDTPLVSVLVPYYNMGSYLPETLRAIRAQTFTDYEIVLVDDGSTDAESVELLERIQAPDLRIIRQRNGGLSAARNTGLRHARGHYVLPLDPDDLISPTFLEKTVAVMEGTPGLGYATSLVSYFVDDPARMTGGFVPWGMERDALWVANVASTCTALMERTVLLDLGGYDEWFTGYEDWDVFCSLAERGLEGSVIPEPLFHYRVRHDSMTRTSLVSERDGLMARLNQKHPRLASNPERALRIHRGEARKHEARLLAQAAAAIPPPLMERVVDRVNGTLKRFDFVHHALRGAASRVLGAEGDSRPLRHQLADRLRRKAPPRR